MPRFQTPVPPCLRLILTLNFQKFSGHPRARSSGGTIIRTAREQVNLNPQNQTPLALPKALLSCHIHANPVMEHA